ncbi:MAG: protein-L-isoaspartate(D-aspartate) O-methyltransferase [Thermoplasmatota archaeon]
MGMNDDLVRNLMREGIIRSRDVERAMLSVDRSYFVPGRFRREAYFDHPLQIGEGQTISAPHMVAIMAEELLVHEGHRVLEVGGGSGYHAAVIAKMVGSTGHVYTVERIPSLVKWGRENLIRAGIDNVTFIEGDGSTGYPEGSPYDRIYYTCAAPNIPQVVIDQLTDGGIILGIVGPKHGVQRLMRYIKIGNRIEKEGLTRCVFVPLIGEMGY